MDSPSALTEHVSLNLAGTFLLDPVVWIKINTYFTTGKDLYMERYGRHDIDGELRAHTPKHTHTLATCRSVAAGELFGGPLGRLEGERGAGQAMAGHVMLTCCLVE